jgi:ATP-binding cassette subfamily F protein uup
VEARRTRNEGRVRALKQLRIQRSERRERIGQVEIRVQDAAPSGKLVFEAVDVTQTFGAAPVIAGFSARIMRGDRIGIIGPNGCGKTTLIKLLVGELTPTSGTIRRGTAGAIAGTGEHAVGRRTQPLASGAVICAAQQSSGDG